MKNMTFEGDVFSSIQPETLMNFLTVNDWVEVNRVSNEFIVLGKNKKLVWVPVTSTTSDFSSLIYRVIKSVAETDGKTEAQIIEDLQTVAIGDVIRVRSFDPYDNKKNSIPLADGINLLTRTKQMALAAAASAVSKKPIHSRRPPVEARQYVRNLRLEQTEPGSYIVKLVSPIDVIPLMNGEFSNFSERIPFSRRAVVELVNGLNALNEATEEVIKRGFDFNYFLEAVPKGVSANLCEALSATIYHEEQDQVVDAPLEVSVTWSYLIRDKSLSKSTEVFFSPETFPIIRKAAEEFRGRNPEIITIQGWVNILERESRLGSGHIRIIGRVDDRLRSIRVRLNQEDYISAVDAHRNGYIVSVTGTLIVEKNVYKLENPINFHFIDDEFLSFDL